MATPTLLDRIAHRANLRRAWQWIARREAGPGADGVTVQEFERAPEQNLVRLREELLSGS